MRRIPNRALWAFTLASLSVGGCNCEGPRGLYATTGRLEADPVVVDFGSVTVGASATQSVGLKNTGDFAVELQTPTLSDTQNFKILDAAPTSLRPTEEGALRLGFMPTHEGSFDATLVLENDGMPPEVKVQLKGVATPAPASCTLALTPDAIDFTMVPVGQAKESTVTIKNVSVANCTLSSIAITGPSQGQFTLETRNPGTVAAGASLDVQFRLTRANASAITAAFEVESSDPAMPKRSVPLTAAGQGPGLCVVPTAIHFGVTRGVGTRAVNLTACGDHDVTIQGLDWSTPDATIALLSPPSIPFSIVKGQSKSLMIAYTPASAMSSAHAVLTIRANDPLVPSVPVDITGSPDIVAPTAGRYLYYWQVKQGLFQTSEIMRLPLQGASQPQPYWGMASGQVTCPGCHHISPDGRYVAIVEFLGTFRTSIIDTTTNTKVAVPSQIAGAMTFSWKPKVDGGYPYVAAADGKILLGSLHDGYIGELQGANEGGQDQSMPTWGSNGQIAFVRGHLDEGAQGLGFAGPTDLVVVPEGGGTAKALKGASANGLSNFYPKFSPNGLWITYTESKADSTYAAADAQIRLVKADGSGTVLPLSNMNGTSGATSYPTWSIDGTFLSFSSNRPGGMGGWDIYLAPIDPMTGADSTPMNLQAANSPNFEHGAEWSP